MKALKSMVEDIRSRILGMEEDRLSQTDLSGTEVQISREYFVQVEVKGTLIEKLIIFCSRRLPLTIWIWVRSNSSGHASKYSFWGL